VTTQNIETLLHKRESEQLEFKSAEAGAGALAADLCALLNGQGGTIIVGVDENRRVTPLAHPENKARQIETYVQQKISPSSVWSVNVVPVPRGEVVVIDAPAGSERPYVCDGSIYVRKGGNTVAADAAAIRALVAQQHSEPTLWERLPAAGLEVENLASEKIRATVDEAQRRRNYAFRDPGDVAAVLSDLGLMQSGMLTNGADVLFADNPSSRLPQTRIRAVAYATNKGGDHLDGRLFEGNAFDLLHKAFSFVEQHVRVVSEFKSRRVEREDRPQYPFWALREGLTNAIIHRDYSIYSGGMGVEIYPDRIEIWNTGRLPKGWKPADLKRSHPSQPANPRMAHVFYLRGIIEQVGRGTLKIVDDCQAAGLRSPEWREVPSGIKLVFDGRRRRARLNQRQRELIERLRPGDAFRPSDYYKETEAVVGERQSRRDLAGLEKGGWLRQEGEGPATVYVRTDQPP
jgi:ATP-dependent DNA helicase RecG